LCLFIRLDVNNQDDKRVNRTFVTESALT